MVKDYEYCHTSINAPVFLSAISFMATTSIEGELKQSE
jgi:hypothetical protein